MKTTMPRKSAMAKYTSGTSLLFKKLVLAYYLKSAQKSSPMCLFYCKFCGTSQKSFLVNYFFFQLLETCAK